MHDHDNIQKATAILKPPTEREYAYDNIADIVNIVKTYIPFRSQPRDLKIQTPIAASRLHSKSILLRMVCLALSAVLF